MQDKTAFVTEGVGTSYVEIADFSKNKYPKYNLQLLSPEAKEIHLARHPDQEYPTTIVPQGVPAVVFDNYKPAGKLYAKIVGTGTAKTTVNIW